jgi:adenylosuccinate lyase
MKVWEDGADFLEALLADKDVTKALPAETIRAQFDLGYHTKHVDTIFKRVFGDGGQPPIALAKGLPARGHRSGS